jgi:hypothetical protein
MESKKACSVTRISNYKVRRHFHTLAKQHEASLPSPSSLYSNIIFLFDEALATKGRELLFKRLNRLAAQNEQFLIVTDVGYDRGGFYLNFDELGAGSDDGEKYEACIEAWESN